MNIDTSLLREKFIITEDAASVDGRTLNIIACSNRMEINLQAGELQTETYIVRSHAIYNCVRMVVQMIHHYDKGGPLMSRTIPIDWEDLWDHAQNGYERIYDPDRWIAVYHNGKKIYEHGKHHSFLDVIEQCNAMPPKDYQRAVKMAEDAFKAAGKNAKIHYKSNVSIVAVLQKKETRCSVALREPDRTMTFNYSIKPHEDDKKGGVNVTQGLTTAADFLEGVQLAYFIGSHNEKLEQGVIEKFSPEDKQTKHAAERIRDIDVAINTMENRYKVRYRPERPDFKHIIQVAEKVTRKQIKDEQKALKEQ